MQQFKNAEVLTREQLKKVLGGTDPETGFGYSCKCSDGKHSAGMSDCANCDKWCKDQGYGGKDTCD